jgi:cell division protein FtsL
MKMTDRRSLVVRGVTGVLLLLSCFWMYDFYKCLSGFIANGFREPLVMLPMILGYFLPVLCFLFFFYDVFVRAIHPVVKTLYSVFVAAYAAVDLALILNQMELYASNHALGVYDALPGIILRFPFDMLVILPILLAWQICKLTVADRPTTRMGAWLNRLKQRGTLDLRVVEYLILCVLAIVVFVFTGAAVFSTFSAFENALYDVRYVFLLLWVMIIPMANLALLTLRPEKMKLRRPTKMIILGSGIGANLISGLLFLIAELTYPDFLIHIGKPVFLIAFSVSLPIEPGVILGIMAVGTLVLAIRMVLVAGRRYDRPSCGIGSKTIQGEPPL